MRDEIRGLVSGLLSLCGVEADPVSDPRHILLARVLEDRWRQGQPVDLAGLVALAENPPFSRVGALDLDTVLPREKRRDLALALNNLLSSPGFDSWRAGEPLDPQRLLADESGRPACNLFYLAHLDDRERMFFVSRFLERLWAWTRVQSGATDLRALLYFDEVFGFLPPVAEPPSKRPLLSLLKQARAFGVGVLAVTQNPVDLDYKALTNAGTWMVGRLQAERDKERLLDGLEGAGLGMSRAEADRALSGLEKRRFLLHDVHRKGGPVVFESRWARAYLRGPLTLRQIPDLARGFAEAAPGGPAPAKAGAEPAESGAPVPPALDPVFQPRFAPGSPGGAALSGELAVLLEARISRQRPAVSGSDRRLVRFGSGPAPVPAADGSTRLEDWGSSPPAGVSYGPLPPWATKGNAVAALEKAAREQVAAEGFTLETVPELGLARQPGEGGADFAARVSAAVEAAAAKQTAKVGSSSRAPHRDPRAPDRCGDAGARAGPGGAGPGGDVQRHRRRRRDPRNDPRRRPPLRRIDGSRGRPGLRANPARRGRRKGVGGEDRGVDARARRPAVRTRERHGGRARAPRGFGRAPGTSENSHREERRPRPRLVRPLDTKKLNPRFPLSCQ